LPLHVLQSLQQFAHARPQAPDTVSDCRSWQPNPDPARAEGRIDRWK
jgi:hypothetical protein